MGKYKTAVYYYQRCFKKINVDEKKITGTITFIKDRPGHDRRYAIDCTKLKNELNWKRQYTFEAGLQYTVDWYIRNVDWIENIRSGEYRSWLEKNYDKRENTLQQS